MYVPGPDLITGIMATESAYIVIRHSQRKFVTTRQGGPVIPSNFFMVNHVPEKDNISRSPGL